jgi:hypothetical protein
VIPPPDWKPRKVLLDDELTIIGTNRISEPIAQKVTAIDHSAGIFKVEAIIKNGTTVSRYRQESLKK